MKRLFPFALLMIFALCTAQMCAKDVLPAPASGPTITADKGNKYLAYDYSLGGTGKVSFTVGNVDEATVITAKADGLVTEVLRSEGYRNILVTVKLQATEDFGDETDLVITASNAAGSVTKSFVVERARMVIEKTVYDNVTAAGIQLGINLSCNIDADIRVDEGCGDMLSLGVSKVSNQLIVIVAKNPDMQPRTGTITFSDADGVIPPITVTVNQLASAIPAELNEATDRQALRAICEALHMQDWLDDTECIKWDRPIREWYTTFTGERIQRLGLGNAGREIIHYGVIPDELGWLNCITSLEISDKISGPLPKTLGGCKSLTTLTMYQSCEITEKLNDSSLKDVIGHLRSLMISPGFYGSFPEWFANMPETGNITPSETHLSGRIPDVVARMKPMQKNWAYGLTVLEGFIAYAKSYYNFALWVGEQPSNVKFVTDEHDGHWEWTDTVFDEATQTWKFNEDNYYNEWDTLWCIWNR